MRALKLLNTLFSPTVLPDEKKRILSKKYNIAMTVELESEVQRMSVCVTWVLLLYRKKVPVPGKKIY